MPNLFGAKTNSTRLNALPKEELEFQLWVIIIQ